MPQHEGTTWRCPSGYVGGGSVTITFDFDANIRDAEHYAETHGWFGYHPAGHNGEWRQVDARTWRYSFRVTGD